MAKVVRVQCTNQSALVGPELGHVLLTIKTDKKEDERKAAMDEIPQTK